MLYNVSPFERVLSESGGSLMLAVINGSVSFPERDRRPQPVRELVLQCLTVDPGQRPAIADVIDRARAVLQSVQQLQPEQQQAQRLRDR